MDQYVGWSLLPDNLLLKVFVMLKEIDMVHASSTCTTWRRMFYEPRFWRSVTFNLKSLCKKPVSVQEKLQKHVQTVSPMVKHVTIICPSSVHVVPRLMADCVKVILDTLAENNSSILSFRLKKLQMHRQWVYLDYDYTKSGLINSLCHFIESQTRLQTLVINEALLPTEFSHMVMSSLARSPSVDTLQQLDICYLFAFYQEYNREQGELIRSALFECKNLKEITLNNRLLKAIEVEKLCEHFQQSLTKLQLKTISTLAKSHNTDYLAQNEVYDDYTNGDADYDNDDGDNCFTYHMRYISDYERIPAIASESWEEAIRFCPGLNVSVEMDLVDVELENILAPAMPVSHLTINSLLPDGWVEDDELYQSDVDDEVGLGDTMDHLCDFHFKNLKSAIFVGQNDERLSSLPEMEYSKFDVVNFFKQHPELTSFQISSNLMSPALFRSVKEEIRERYGVDRDILNAI